MLLLRDHTGAVVVVRGILHQIGGMFQCSGRLDRVLGGDFDLEGATRLARQTGDG